MRILLVDDSEELLDLVKRALLQDGHEVRVAETIAEAHLELAREAPEVLVLDVALPDGTGFELCRELRTAGSPVPILLLTAHGEVHQRVAGLDAGADDFLAKPFAIAELRARVRALARRGPLSARDAIVRAGVTVDLGARRAIAGGIEVPITAREWAVIELLAARRGRVVDKSVLLETIWGDADEGANASLEVLVGRIRRKLGTDFVRTVRGQGYLLDDDYS